MNIRTYTFGSHHSHFQPRIPNGRFISYADSGRGLGKSAVAQNARVVVGRRGVTMTRRRTSTAVPAAVEAA